MNDCVVGMRLLKHGIAWLALTVFAVLTVAAPALAEKVASATLGNATYRYSIDVTKKSVADDGTQSDIPWGDSHMDGARFEVRNSSASSVVVNGTTYGVGAVVGTIVTARDSATGTYHGTLSDLPYGTYTVTESAPPTGHDRDTSWSQTVVAHGDDGTVYPLTCGDLVSTGGVRVRKVDSAGVDKNGNATLEGAVFELRNASVNPVIYKGKRCNVGDVVTTMTAGYGRVGDVIGYWASASELPYGSYTVTEKSAPHGYELNETWRTIAAVHAAGVTTDVGECADDVSCGGVSVDTVDAGTGESVPQGDASFDMVYEVVNDGNPVTFGGVTYQHGEVVATITADPVTGHAETSDTAVPVGVYIVRCKSASVGYRHDPTWSVRAFVTEGATIFNAGAYEAEVQRGGVSQGVLDADNLTHVSQGDGLLDGAVFEFINRSTRPVVVNGVTYDVGEVVHTNAANDDAIANVPASTLPYGTYEVRQASAGEGYLPDEEWSGTFEIREDGGIIDRKDAAPLAVVNRIQIGGFRATTVDAEIGESVAQGDGDLGAIYQIKTISRHDVYINGDRMTPNSIVAMVKTDSETGLYETASRLPYGTYRVTHVWPSTGYTLTENYDSIFKVTGEGVITDLEPCPIQVKRNGLAVENLDAETVGSDPLGAASLEGVETVEVYNRASHPVMVNGNLVGIGERALTLDIVRETDEDGVVRNVARTADVNALPYGRYEVVKGKTTEGYTVDGTQSRKVSLGYDAEGMDATLNDLGKTLTLFGEKYAMRENVIRGDLRFVKRDEKTQKPMEGVAFLVTAESTGERHVIVSGKDGLATTETAVAAHTNDPNRNDNALTFTEDGKPQVDSDKLNASYGTWFAGEVEGGAKPNDELCALPYDTYTVDELRCDANEGRDLVQFTFAVTADGICLDMGNVDDPTATVKTEMICDATQGHTVSTDAHATSLTDFVTYAGLDENVTYTLVTTLRDIDPQGNATNLIKEMREDFQPKASSATTFVEMPVDVTELEGHSLVAHEIILRDGHVLAAETDDQNADQTVRVVESQSSIDKTTLTYADSGSHTVPFGAPSVVLRDDVELSGLEAGADYELETTIVDETGEPIANPTRTRLAPTEGEDKLTVSAPVSVSRSKLAVGKHVVAFERLYRNGVLVAEEADLENADQTAVVGSVARIDSTELTHNGSHEVPLDKWVVPIADTVRLSGLAKGETYTLSMRLVRTDTGEDCGDATPFTFEATDESMSVDVPARMNALDAPVGEGVTAYETLSLGGSAVSAETEFDEAQTVRVAPSNFKIDGTELTADGSHDLWIGGSVTCFDMVSFSGAVPGREYRLHTALVLADGTEYGEPVEMRFTPKTTSGEVRADVNVETDGLSAGDSLTAFERVSTHGVDVAEEADLDNEEQTVWARVATSGGKMVTYMPKTGGSVIGAVALVVGALVVAAGVGLALRRGGRVRGAHAATRPKRRRGTPRRD